MLRGDQGSGNVVMERRKGGGREENKALGMRLWSIVRGAERCQVRVKVVIFPRKGTNRGPNCWARSEPLTMWGNEYKRKAYDINRRRYGKRNGYETMSDALICMKLPTRK